MNHDAVVGISTASCIGLIFLVIIVLAVRAANEQRAMLTEAARALGADVLHVSGTNLKANVGDFLLEVTLYVASRRTPPGMGIKVTATRPLAAFLFFAKVQPDVLARIASGAEPEFPPSGHRLNATHSFEGRPATAVDPILGLPGMREMLVTAAGMPNIHVEAMEDRVWIHMTGYHDAKDGKLELERIRLALRLAEAAQSA
jgi:hypothetical protein